MKLVLPKSKAEKQNPVDYFFLLDLSGSMWDNIDAVKDTMRATKNLLGEKDTITIGWFSSYNEFGWVVKGASLKDRNIEKLIEDNIYARGLTCYTQSLNDLFKVVQDVQGFSGNKMASFSFLSDGMPNHNSPINEVYSICSKLKSVFNVTRIIGYGKYYNRNILLDMADRIGGSMNHISDFEQLKKNCSEFVSTKKTIVNVPLDKKYDLVWQVSNDIVMLSQNADNSVDAQETDGANVMYAINFDELDGLKQSDLIEGRFVYSLAYVLSQRNKANLGVGILKKALDLTSAQMLRKAFTTEQKGNAELMLKDNAINFGDSVNATEAKPLIALNDFVNKLVSGNAAIDTKQCKYRSISRKNKDLDLVATTQISTHAKILDVVGNENRPNLSFKTVVEVSIDDVNDPALKARVADYNKSHSKNKIEFPIKATMYKNYTFVANGDFNYEKFVYELDGHTYTIRPSDEIEIFDSSDLNFKASDFVEDIRTLLTEKAECSVLRFLIDSKGESRHSEDLREKLYHIDAVPILKDMGLDYAMRYAKKEEYKQKDENADYVTFLSISGQIKGASTINAKDAHEKIQAGKSNAVTAICQPFFDKYAKIEKTIKDPKKLIEVFQGELKTKIATQRAVAAELANRKFVIGANNIWFSDLAEKTDQFELNGVVVKVKEEKEYL